MKVNPDPNNMKPMNPWPLIIMLIVVGYIVANLQGWI